MLKSLQVAVCCLLFISSLRLQAQSLMTDPMDPNEATDPDKAMDPNEAMELQQDPQEGAS